MSGTLLILVGLGVLAWLLAGGWTYARDEYVADDGPLGLGAGITAVCPACAGRDDAARDQEVAARSACGRVVSASAVLGSLPDGTSLRPYGVGRGGSLQVSCPACGTVYSVVGSGTVIPAPRDERD